MQCDGFRRNCSIATITSEDQCRLGNAVRDGQDVEWTIHEAHVQLTRSLVLIALVYSATGARDGRTDSLFRAAGSLSAHRQREASGKTDEDDRLMSLITTTAVRSGATSPILPGGARSQPRCRLTHARSRRRRWRPGQPPISRQLKLSAR